MLDPDITTREALTHLHVAESDPNALDRRRFLQLVGMGVGVGALTGGLDPLLGSFGGGSPSAWAAGPIGPTDGVLVVIGMYGGNDGLNTVVPINDGRYYDQHGPLALPAGAAIPLDAATGLHPQLTELKRFWDQGQLAIVEGVGYPNPDFSHFSSLAYWMAGRPNALPTTGWLGRWLDGYLGGAKDLYAAAEIGTSVPLHLVGAQSRGTVVPPDKPGFGSDQSDRSRRNYAAVRAMRTPHRGAWFEAVAAAFGDSIDMARVLTPVVPESESLPDDRLSAGLEVAARLINADLGFRVLTAGWGDFDSHAGQPDMHPDRMAELNAAVVRFFQTLEPRWASRVTVMTYSEFGRTPWGNDGLGTDHGTSAPHFVFGANVRGGRYGQRPTLAGLGRWDRMAHHVDFRSYYASIIDGWLGGGSSDVLGGSFEDLGLFAAGPGEAAPGPDGPIVVTAPSTFVPLTPTRLADTRSGEGVARGPIRGGTRVRVRVTGRGGVPSSGVTAIVANVVAVDATSPTYFTVYPGGSTRPTTANLNAGPGRPVPNLVTMQVGDDGHVQVFNSHGTAHCVIDVFGYYRTGSGDRFTAVRPTRLFDTRTGEGVRRGKLRNGAGAEIQVAGKAGVPASGATAVVMNLAVTEPESAGWLRVRPSGAKAAMTANVNFAAGDTVPNLVICKLGSNGKIVLDGAGVGSHAIGDVFGYFGAEGDQLRATSPRRVLDTRTGVGARKGPVGPGKNVKLPLAGAGVVPANATAVALNVAVTNVAGPSYVTVWPSRQTRPGTANLNLAPGQTLANLVVCRLGTDGALLIANPLANCDVIADVFGYFVD